MGEWKSYPITIGGGIDGTACIIHGQMRDEFADSGHYERPDDLQKINEELSIDALRYAFPWEKIAPNGIENADWSWPDKQVPKLKSLFKTPIFGMCHHGSGPEYARIDQPNFPEEFATYAQVFAERYFQPETPDGEHQEVYVLPVNEPLTTARLTCLYAKWEPHKTDDRSYITALLNQCKATVLAMQEIRKVNKNAKLVTTEDFGSVSCPEDAPEELKAQAAFDNDRRWWSNDLLMGIFNENHTLWKYAEEVGFSQEELQEYQAFFLHSDVRPDIIGVDYYVTSDRWLDHRLQFFPGKLHGGNGRVNYVDTEAARVSHGIRGIEHVLEAVWNRYHVPLWVTESHLGCKDVSEQMKWFDQSLKGAEHAAENGVDISMVIAWALNGLNGWDKLKEETPGKHEPGAYTTVPEHTLTRYGEFIAARAKGEEGYFPELQEYDGLGWWEREDGILYRPESEEEQRLPLPAAGYYWEFSEKLSVPFTQSPMM